MTDQVTYSFRCQGFPEDTFQVARFMGDEGISKLYRFQLDLVSDDPDLVIDDILNQPCTFTIVSGNGQRAINGIAADIEIFDQADELTVYRLLLVPQVWQLTLTQVNTVYLDTTTVDIIQQTLERIGITSADYRLDLDGDYRRWDFRLQYGESHWQFLSRTLERDGIYYYFVAADGHEKIVFCDTRLRQAAIVDPNIRYAAGLGMDAGDFGATVHSLVCRQRRLPRTVIVQNYNDARPSTRIREEAEVDVNGCGEINIYGQNVLDPNEARALAAIRAEEIRCGKTVYHGESTVCRMVAGQQFNLTGHFRAAMNQEYLIVAVEHSGYDPRLAGRIGLLPEPGTPVYENRFTAIPADVQYRPPRLTEKPRIHGTLNAKVDAEGDGEYAELDEEGRYRIVFPFDTDHPEGKASHWVRMIQPYSGEREGMHFPLRKNARVLVSFLGGDPDLPVIAGAIPNSEQPSVTTAEHHTKSRIRTAGGNLLQLDDTADAQQVQLFSPLKLTRLRLGAAADDTDSGGISLSTSGLDKTVVLGAYNWLYATKGRVEPDEEGEVSIEAAQQQLFKFPRKHAPAAGGASDSPTITAEEERSGHLHVLRDTGIHYNWLEGSEFNFTAGSESYDFGPAFEYTAARHDQDPEELKDRLFAIFPRFADGASGHKLEEWAQRYFGTRLSDDNRDWAIRLSHGRISIADHDAFLWHSGNIYDFGGAAMYGLGNGYSENHVEADAVLNQKDPQDLLDRGGPEWEKIHKLDPLLENDCGDNRREQAKWPWTRDYTVVEKTFGNTYSLHKGGSFEVRMGDSQTVTVKGGANVEMTVNDKGNVTRYYSEHDGITKEKIYSPYSSSTLVKYSTSKKYAGTLNELTCDFSPASSMNISYAPAASTSIKLNTDFALELNGGFTNKIEAFAGTKFSLSTALALDISLEYATGGKIKAENSEYTVKLPGICTKTNVVDLTKKVTALEDKVASLEKTEVHITNISLSLSKTVLSVKNTLQIFC